MKGHAHRMCETPRTLRPGRPSRPYNRPVRRALPAEPAGPALQTKHQSSQDLGGQIDGVLLPVHRAVRKEDDVHGLQAAGERHGTQQQRRADEFRRCHPGEDDSGTAPLLKVPGALGCSGAAAPT